MSNPPLKIAIIGAGPAGLTLARLLQVLLPPSTNITIFEADSSSTARPDQGGMLDIHHNSGQLVLQEAGLLDEFRKYSRPEAEALKLIDTITGEVLWDENGEDDRGDNNRPEIDRVKLREILLNSVDEKIIKWGWKLSSVEEVDDNSEKKKKAYTLHFSSPASTPPQTRFDLVLGCDGAWSKVRPILTDIKPFYSSISCIELWSHAASNNNNPWLSSYIGKGSMFSFDQDRGILSQRNGDGSIRTYACLRQPEDWISTCGINWTAEEEARTKLVERYFNDVAPDLKRLILESRDALITRTLYMLPVGHTWSPKSGVTLVGDAAHLMTPFAGVGVNVAMQDALVLAKALAEHSGSGGGGGVEKALRVYEEEMFARGKKNAERTYSNMGRFKKGGSAEFAGMMKKWVQMAKEGKGGH